MAKTLIALRGGPAAILNTNLPKQARFGGGVTVSPARFWLEMLAVYETFGESDCTCLMWVLIREQGP